LRRVQRGALIAGVETLGGRLAWILPRRAPQQKPRYRV